MRRAILASVGILLCTGCTRAGQPSSEPHWETLSPSSAASVRSSPPVQKPTSENSIVPIPHVPPPTPKTTLLPVPFTSQTPLLNWDDVHEETCEEASLLMVHRFLLGERENIPPEDADRDLLALVAWEEKNGYPVDVTVEQLGAIAKKYYGYTPVIEETVTVERIKEIIAGGSPIIIPAAGRELGNPYFSGAGPWYHMLVIRGYDRNEFIVNDPGTRRGGEYHYSYETLIAAIHDWTGVKEETNTGAKRMLILRK